MELTDAAIEQVTKVVNEDENAIALRIGVKSGGCGGYEYTYSLATETSFDTIIVTYDSAAIMTDLATNNLLQNATLDYAKTLGGAEFVITNPNTTAMCGCGKSFNVEDFKIDTK